MEDAMNFINKLSALVSSNKLPVNERVVAKSLLSCQHVVNFFAESIAAEIVLVVPSVVPSHIIHALNGRNRIKSVLFPVKLLKIMSPSPMETAKHTSLTVCSLLKKIFNDRNPSFRGVLTLEMGIYVNEMSAPGALIWQLQDCNFIKFIVSSINLVSSVWFVDSFTLSSRMGSRWANKEMTESLIGPNQLISDALILLGTEDNMSVAANDVIDLALSLIPLVCQRSV